MPRRLIHRRSNVEGAGVKVTLTIENLAGFATLAASIVMGVRLVMVAGVVYGPDAEMVPSWGLTD